MLINETATLFSGHLETVEMENRNGQNENDLLFNTYFSKKTTCKSRPLELCHTVHASISQKL